MAHCARVPGRGEGALAGEAVVLPLRRGRGGGLGHGEVGLAQQLVAQPGEAALPQLQRHLARHLQQLQEHGAVEARDEIVRVQRRRARAADDGAVDEEHAVQPRGEGLELPAPRVRGQSLEGRGLGVLGVDGQHGLLARCAAQRRLPLAHLLALEVGVEAGDGAAHITREGGEQLPLVHLGLAGLVELGLVRVLLPVEQLHLQPGARGDEALLVARRLERVPLPQHPLR
mmetsp:Transcript_1153/g.2829  ORF Transcript_1153/g.2829 Transcript_1153/m.2829 type:complete len:229 (-) Transcript_1153:459-1145(-)